VKCSTKLKNFGEQFLSHWSKFGAKSQIYYFGGHFLAFKSLKMNDFANRQCQKY